MNSLILKSMDANDSQPVYTGFGPDYETMVNTARIDNLLARMRALLDGTELPQPLPQHLRDADILEHEE